jgi:23S rRNA pseudouridine2605 synthase
MSEKPKSGGQDRPRRRVLDAPGAKTAEKREGQRIAKVIARAGLCSRRDAEAWIAEGRVVVNGARLDSPAFNVSPSDDVRVDGKPLAAPERTRLFLYNKPRGLVTTARDPEGRPTIFENLPEDLPRLIAVGRLDINTEGLLLLTNDGGLARVLELPATGWLRRYRVRAHGEIAQDLLDPLKEGVTIDGVAYAGIEAILDRSQGANVWITMGLREGKNREIKKVLDHLGLAVNRLIRISFGPFQLADLEEGAIAEVRTRVLRDQLGPKLAREANVDFDAPVTARGAAAPAEAPAPARGRMSAPPAARAGAPRDGSRPRAAPGRARKPAPEGFEQREARAKADPKTSYGPKTRKHVSTLRALKQEDASGPRKRIERGAAVDRKGREVQVERLLPTIEEARRRAAAAARAKARKPAAAEGRPGGRGFRAGDRTRPGGEAPPRRGAPAAEAAAAGASPARAGAVPRGARKPRNDSDFSYAPRRDGDKPFRKPPGRDAAARDDRRGVDEPFRKSSARDDRGGAASSARARPFRDSATGRGPRPKDEAKPFRKGPGGGPPKRGGAGKPFRKGPPRDRSGGGAGGKPGGARPPRRG